MVRLISNVTVCDVEVPLRKPYYLSFVTLTRFRSIQVRIELEDGRAHTAEVVPLPGYSRETESDVVHRVKHFADLGSGLALDAFRKLIEAELGDRNFALSPLLCAIDLFEFGEYEIPVEPGPTVKAVAAGQLDLSMIRATGPGTCIKVKLSGRTDADLAAMQALEALARTDLRYRLDANQAYSLEDARRFVSRLKNSTLLPQIDYLEQPLPLEDWEGQTALSEQYTFLDFMLDEGVFTRAEIARARTIGVTFVKLKLFKQGGVKELLDQARFAHELGLKVVIGNGVATEVSNRLEIGVYRAHRDWFYGPHEANGYLKTQ